MTLEELEQKYIDVLNNNSFVQKAFITATDAPETGLIKIFTKTLVTPYSEYLTLYLIFEDGDVYLTDTSSINDNYVNSLDIVTSAAKCMGFSLSKNYYVYLDVNTNTIGDAILKFDSLIKLLIKQGYIK